MFRELFGLGDPPWVKRLETKLDAIIIQGESDKYRDIRIGLRGQERDEEIMAQVQVAQELLDGVADQAASLVVLVNGLDLTKLPEADSSRLIAGMTSLAGAINAKAFPTTEPTPVPEPSPEPGPVEPEPTPEEPTS